MSQETPDRVLVLGAGCCGLYAALKLAQAGVPVTVLEKELVPGGLARGTQHGANHYDLGVHMLHAFDREVFEDVQRVMGDERIEVPLDAKIKWAGGFYRYPLQFGELIRGIPKWKLLRCSLGLLWYPSWTRLRRKSPKNAEEALIQLYGRPLYEFFFKDFTSKYWGFPPAELSATFVTTKMPRLSAVDVIKKLLSMIGIKDHSVQAVETALAEEILHYSRTGAESMPRCLAREIEKLGGQVITDALVTAVHRQGNRVTGATWREGGPEGAQHELVCSHMISTIPIPDFIRAMNGTVPRSILEAASHLRYKPIAVYGLLVKKERALDALYVYYRKRSFHRLGEPKNAGMIVEPADHTVLIVETTCEVDGPKWAGEADFVERMVADLQAEGICEPDEIVEKHLLRTQHGYPIFALGFEQHLDRVRDYIGALDNVCSAGRQGDFCFPNMHGAMRMGADAAEGILDEILCEPGHTTATAGD